MPLFCRLAILVTLIGFTVFSDAKGQAVVTTPDSSRTTLLFRAIRSGNAGELEQLLKNGADPNAKSEDYSALMAAALNGSSAQMKLLIDDGATVNYENTNGLTALWLAVPDWDKTSLLLDHGADPRIPSREGFTVLVKLANMPGTENIFHLLMDKGADLKKSGPGNFLLYNAASSCDTAIVGLLIRSGLNVNDTALGDYPLTSALNYRCFPTVKMLVDNGADVNVRPNFQLEPMKGMTPLMIAAVSRDSLSLFYLLDHGADTHATSKKGYTALMYLQQAENDAPEMTLALIEHGAIPSQKAPDGTDALYLARKHGNSGSIAVLNKYLNK